MMQRFDNYGFNPGWSKIPSSDGTVKRPPIMKQDMGLSYAKPEVSSPYMQAKHENQQSTDDYNYGYQDGFYYGFSSSANQSNSSSLKRPYTDYYPMMGYEEPSQGYRNYSDVVGYGYGYNPVLPTRPRATVYSARGRGAHSTLKPRSSIGDQSVKNRFPAPSTFKKPPKVYTTTGKTAAMILNELYPDFKDSCNFTSVQTETKVARFRCSIVVKGQGFEADASNKKLAKQLVCEKALKVLRPDIKLDVTFPESGSEASGRSKNEESKKKKKADPLTTSNSIHDYFLRLCREKETETGVKYNPVFTFTELPAFDTFKPYLKRYRCTLVMKEQRKEYSHEGIGKLPGKNAVIRQALIEVFNVGLNELKAIEKRSVSLRPGKPAQVLLQALNFYGRSMKIEMCKVSSGKTVAGSSERFMAKITIDNNITIEGPVEESPALAKDSACMKVLTEHLELEMPKEEDINLRRAATVLSPCYALHFILSKRNRTSHPDIVYSDPVDISESPQTPPKFKCVLKINGTDTYEGIGSSKKAAKNAVAEHVVRNVLKFDLSENSDIPAIKKIKMDEGSDFCSQICSFVRSEYESICYQQGCPTTSHIAAFVIVSPSGEKSMVSLGAGRNAVVNGHLLVYSPGSVLIHMQAVVLARRGFILFLHRQFENLDSADCIIERSTGSSTYRIKSGYKVVLFTAFAPTPVRMEPLPQKLSCFSSGYSRPVEVPESSQTYEDLLSGKVNVMSVSDKILKWNYLGLQGALMSTIMEPVYISNICVIQHVNEQAVTRAVLLRFGESRKSQLQITSLQEQISPHGEIYHDWVRGIGTVERLDPLTGRTITGSPSRLCKSEMFESWSRMMSHLKNVNSKTYSTCAEAKTNAKVYMNALDSFIEQLDTLELGKWQRKDRRIDDFKLISFDQ